MVHIFQGLAGQAGASASNGASKGQISPILAGPCLAKDNMALGTVPAPGATPHCHTSPTDHSCLACSRVGSCHALCETNAVRWNLTIKRVLTRSLRPVTYNCCMRACLHAGCAWPLHACATVHPCTHLSLSRHFSLSVPTFRLGDGWVDATHGIGCVPQNWAVGGGGGWGGRG
jgi:hypothetical protein